MQIKGLGIYKHNVAHAWINAFVHSMSKLQVLLDDRQPCDG